MTARTPSRTAFVGAAVAALLLPLALVAALASPASAAPGRPHEVYIYKVEKHVDLKGEFPDNYLHEHVYCNPGDWATDGMWRIDHVDQANPPETFGDERDVVVTASYGDDVDQTEWHFRAQNYADGDAQLKLFVTCIRGTVEAAHGHTHDVVVTPRQTYTQTMAPAVGTFNFEYNHSYTCPTGSIAIAPGFRFSKLGSAYDDQNARIYRSWPSSASYRSWYWAFRVTDPDVDVDLYLRCLQIKTGLGGPNPQHVHNLLWAYRSNGYGGDEKFLTSVGTQERRLNCDDGADGRFFQDYKAIVGGFYIADPTHVWYLGQDPRPKQRAYKFWWDGTNPNNVYLTALCVRARTGKQIRP